MVSPPKQIALLPTDADTKIASGVLPPPHPITIFMPEGQFLKPGIVEPHESGPERAGEWYPNSHRTRLLVAAVHAAKDIATYSTAIDTTAPWGNKRAIALLATPLVSMCDHTKALCDQLGRESVERSTWPAADQDLLRDASRRMRRHRAGPLRTLRNKKTAHIDLDELRPGVRTTEALQDLILPPFADTLLLLLLCFNYHRVYTWRRQPPGAPSGEIDIMTEYPLAMRAQLDASGAISALGTHSIIAADPRGPLRDTITEMFQLYNLLASTAEPQHRRITWRER